MPHESRGKIGGPALGRLVRVLSLSSAVALGPHAAGAGAQETRSTLDGVFSAEQVARGEDLMFNICAECHVPEDFGQQFMSNWAGATVYRLMDEIRNTMPEYEPGSLPDTEYVDVLAYMFSLNDLRPGETELASDRETLEGVTIRLGSGGATRALLAGVPARRDAAELFPPPYGRP